MRKWQKGDKVIPIKKSVYCTIENSIVWENARLAGKYYIYVIGYEDGINVLCDWVKNSNTGDYFDEDDLIPYEEFNENLAFQLLLNRVIDDYDYVKITKK